MRKLASMLSAATIAIGMSVSSMVPTNAAPFVSPAPVAPTSGLSGTTDAEVQRVNHRGEFRRHMRRSWGPRGSWGDARYEIRPSPPYYNGYRGYRTYRHGYRRHNNFWFPAGAFVAGAIIGSAISGPRYYEPPRRHYRAGGNAHVRYCYNRYRSYRAWDNTFQPYNGPRRQCRSPYGY